MENKTNKSPKKKFSVLLYYLIILVVVVLIWSWLVPNTNKATETEISYTEFMEMVDNGEIDVVEFKSDYIYAKPKDFSESNTYYKIGEPTLAQQAIGEKLTASDVEFGSIIDTGTSIWSEILYLVAMVGISWIALTIFFRIMSKKMGGNGGVMNFGKSTGKIYAEKTTGKTFDDVAGQDEAKVALKEIIDFLNNPKKYTDIGAKLPKGALLVGPPGTGKTLLAKAVAGEAKVPFFSLSGSEFVEMFVGVGASRVRDLFKQAVENAPCIVFIDEIDAIGKTRDNMIGGNDEREQTLNQLLAEMDGFDSSKGVVILAATNRPEVLDKALLRPGRFDRRIIVDLPDLEGRKAILNVHARDVKMAKDVDFNEIALATAGASGADLENIINEGALRAVRSKKTVVTQKELSEAVEVVIAGEEKRSTVLSEQEKKTVAYHEIGHALVSALLTHTEPVSKITIIPRTSGALGYTMQTPKEEKHLMSKKEALDEITVLTGGRVSEEIKFGEITTGASNDIEKATSLARAMVTQYGMSDKFGFLNLESRQSMYLSDYASGNYSDSTASVIDSEISDIIKSQYERAKALLLENMSVLDALSETLLEKENITGKEFAELLKTFGIETEVKEEKKPITTETEVETETEAEATTEVDNTENSAETAPSEEQGTSENM